VNLKHLGGCILDFNFMNYLYFSKHHILLFSKHVFCRFNPQGQFDNLEAVTKEVNDDGS
jgi:hypothetical protein